MPKVFENPPDPSFAIQAARNFGKYDLAAALSDLIDNSIFADAEAVRITCKWNTGDPEITIRDDGCGMEESVLVDAMKLVCKNPADIRDPADLGRFGMGMKTASFSQAKCLTVISSRGGATCGFRWDIERMKGWRIEKLELEEIRNLSDLGKTGESGTEIIWNKIDRLPDNEDNFNAAVVEAEKNISLVFHRFVRPSSGKPLKIVINGGQVPTIDPFCRSNTATQKLGRKERFKVGDDHITMTTYILPHFSKLSDKEYDKLAGEEGYIKNQGFYVYRNRRLIVYGTWFKLARHEDMSRLARVMIDVPNSLDHIWRINLDKTDIQLPAALRKRFGSLIKKIKGNSVRVYRGRGTRIRRESIVSVWQREATRERIRYKVDLSHPVMEQLLDSVDGDVKERVKDAMSLVSETLPVDTFHSDLNDRPGSVVQKDSDPEGIVSQILRFARFYRETHSDKELNKILQTTEPFKENYRLVAEHLKREGLIK